ncbi:MAG TPA: class I SAM-dependent methyltransferase [Anaerolineales bacterium]|nr:class I SAM-dependent methyltransferase [Anaerolineales bacterium]
MNAIDSGKAIAMGYDVLASEYDSQMLAAQWIRERLWQRMDILFPAGSSVLDVTAGTGRDAYHLVQRNIAVVACDISPKMLDLLRERNPLVKTFVADFNRLEIEGQFDGIITTFAGLNTSADLSSFADKAAGLLRTGGILFIHVLNRWPILNIVSQLLNLRWLDAWRTVMSNPRNVNLGGVSVLHYLWSPVSLYRKVFERHFQMGHIEGQGIIRPLNVNRGDRLEVLERRLAPKYPFYSLGVFFSMELSRR